MDIYTKLGKLVGIPITQEQLALLPTKTMLNNCERFVHSLKSGVEYCPKDVKKEIIGCLDKVAKHVSCNCYESVHWQQDDWDTSQTIL